MPPPTRSKIWNYFSIMDVDSAMCNICFNVYSRKGRTTTSLKNHLLAVHPEEYKLFKKAEEDKQGVIENTQTTSMLIPIQSLSEQLEPVSESLERTKKWDNNDLKADEVDRYVGEMIALQDLPFSFVEGLGFQRLMQHIAPEYHLNGRLHFEDYVCDLLYEKLAGKIREIVDGMNYKSFTAATWSDSSSNVGLLSLTCHGITEHFDQVRVVLRCEALDEGNVGDIISEKLGLLLNEWNISQSVVHCMIRDEGSIRRKVIKQSSFDDVVCTALKLRTAVRAGLKSRKELIELIEKCKQIGNHFIHSTIAQDGLQKVQERLNKPVLNVFQDCATRWNSTCYIFERLLEIKDELCVYSSQNLVPIISVEEWKIMETSVLILTPFEEAKRELSNPSTSISSVIPTVYILTKMLDDFVANSKVHDLTNEIASAIRESMNKQFSNMENNYLFSIATYLDPRYKHKFFTADVKEKVEAEIIRLCGKNVNQPVCKKRKTSTHPIEQRHFQSPSSSNNANRASSVLKNMEIYLDTSSEDEDDDEQKFRIDLVNYLKEKRADISENPLTWWRTKLGISDQIRGLVQRYLSPPAASIISEQFLSNGGQRNGSLRNRLTGEKAAKLLFMKNNLPVVNYEY